MTRIVWDAVDERTYQSGLDHGVLYPLITEDDPPAGVPWNGLVSVNETFVGGESTMYYYDGLPYYNFIAARNFQATIVAYSTPREFLPCLGEKSVIPGLIVTRQPKELFGFAYRSMIGSDEYKLHMVYNATATPSNRSYSTISENVTAPTKTWKIDTVPVVGINHHPTAHFVVDSTKTPSGTLSDVQDILYGTSTTDPRLPTPAELIDLFT